MRFICFSRILSRYYHCQRQADLRNAARTTIRLLESLIRLAQAHARLMFREFVTVQDAIVAVTCVECSMQNSALLGSMNALHTRFPDEPQEEYSRQAKLVLKRLNLEDMIGAIDEMQSIENGGKAGNDAENNLQSRSINVPKDKDREPNSLSADEDSDRVANENDISNDFSDFASPEQLTGVFPISSSEFRTDDFIDEDALDKSTSPLGETASQRKGRNDIVNSNEQTCLRNPPTLRTVLRNKENVDSAKTDTSVDKSKNIMQLFSKRPAPGLSAAVTQVDRKVSQSEGSGIFVTEELDDEDLEMDWPSDILASFQKEKTVNHSRTVLSGSSENSLASNLIRFNSKKT